MSSASRKRGRGRRILRGARHWRSRRRLGAARGPADAAELARDRARQRRHRGAVQPQPVKVLEGFGARRRRAENQHEQRDAERSADLARGLVDGASRRRNGPAAGSTPRPPTAPGRSTRCRARPATCPAASAPGRQARRRRRSRTTARPAAKHSDPGSSTGRKPTRAASLSGEAGDHRDDQRSGRHRQAGMHDRVAPHVGQEQDVAEQHREEAHRVDDGGAGWRSRTGARANRLGSITGSPDAACERTTKAAPSSGPSAAASEQPRVGPAPSRALRDREA